MRKVVVAICSFFVLYYIQEQKSTPIRIVYDSVSCAQNETETNRADTSDMALTIVSDLNKMEETNANIF